jgi:2-desacetyl-2-hydroxyethyl bacteriochlorophyllide A dehydrogenase
MSNRVSNVCVAMMDRRSARAIEGPVPTPAAGQVLIRTIYSGISAGTEMNVYRGIAPQWRTRQDPHSGLFVAGTAEWTYPLVYGYANVGQVEDLGLEVAGVNVGDLVFSYTPHCAWVVADATDVVTLPELPDVRRAVFLANLNTALNGVLDARPSIGDVVVVSGLGVIGLIVTRLLRRAGAGCVIGVDPLEHRRQRALEGGADLALAPGSGVAELVRERTDGRGADVVIEVSGVATALNEAIRTVGFAGRVIAMSWYGGTFENLSLSGEFHHSRVRIHSSQVDSVNPDLGPLWSTSRRMGVALGLLVHLPLEDYITHEFALTQAGEAYEMIDRGVEPAIQCIFTYPA